MTTLAYEKTYQDYLTYLNMSIGPLPAHISKLDAGSIIGTQNFTGTNSFEEAVQKAIIGDPELEKKVQELSDSIYTDISHKEYTPEFFFSEIGDDVDVSRFLEGDPECMIYTEPVPKERKGGRIIKIVIAGSMPWYVAKERIILRGAAVMALSNLMEKNHYRTEIILSYSISNTAVNILLKRPEDRFDLARFVFAVISPSAFRRIHFGYMERNFNSQLQREMGVPHGGYGIVHNGNCPKGDLNLTDDFDAFTNLDYAKTWIEQKIKEIKAQ